MTEVMKKKVFAKILALFACLVNLICSKSVRSVILLFRKNWTVRDVDTQL